MKIVMGISVMKESRISVNKIISLREITKEIGEIFQTAYEVLREMGTYNLFVNNCQHYAKQLAKKLGAPKEYKTDVELRVSKAPEIVEGILPIIVDYYIKAAL